MSYPLTITVRYPTTDTITLRTEDDWDREIQPLRAETKDGAAVFKLKADRPHLYYKPVLLDSATPLWSQGPNFLAVSGQERTLEAFPYFKADTECSVCALNFIDSKLMGQRYDLRVFLPPGYYENTLHRYPVLYMQDGHNLFFPDEAAFGDDWKVRETIERLTEMNQTDPMIVVGIRPNDRMAEYTAPGFEKYARFMAEELKPLIDSRYRTRPEPLHNAVMGSSLGGVVSLHTVLQHPKAFGAAACLSSTFGFRDDLLDRVVRDKKPNVRVYLDSGWPRDNFETTRAMRAALLRKGFEEGKDLMYFAFPEARHNEKSWSMRCHLPMQFLFGRG